MLLAQNPASSPMNNDFNGSPGIQKLTICLMKILVPSPTNLESLSNGLLLFH